MIVTVAKKNFENANQHTHSQCRHSHSKSHWVHASLVSWMAVRTEPFWVGGSSRGAVDLSFRLVPGGAIANDHDTSKILHFMKAIVSICNITWKNHLLSDITVVFSD